MVISRTGGIALLLILIAVVTGWLLRSSPATTHTPKNDAGSADFFLEDFQINQFDETGLKSYQLYGQRLDHYPNNDSTLISAPDIIVNPEQAESKWNVEAEKGLLRPEAEDELVFTGNVKIQRQATTTQATIHMQTEFLLLKPKAQVLHSSRQVTLSSPGNQIIADKLHADLKLNRMTLYNVVSKYEP